MNNIKLNMELSLLIDERLKKENIFRNKKISDPDFTLFSYEELLPIKAVRLQNFTTLDDLDKLPNLEIVQIISTNGSSVSSSVDTDSCYFVNHIKDFTMLEKLPQLRRLTIINDNYLTNLDISSLTNLEDLKLINNNNLVNLKGLEDLTNLKSVMEYGNNILNSLDISKYMKNTKNTYINVIDICRYPHMVDNPSEANALIEKLKEHSITFAEKTALYTCYIMRPKQVYDIYNKSYSLINKNSKNELFQTVRDVYNTVVETNSFDYGGLEKRYESFKNLDFDYSKVPFEEQHQYILLHTSYAACMEHKSNCEGYVNYMKFLLSMKDIHSVDVYCSRKTDDNTNMSVNHSILRVNINGIGYYFDPTIEKKGQNKWAFKTYDEVSLTHNLSCFEKEKANKEQINGKHISKIIKK